MSTAAIRSGIKSTIEPVSSGPIKCAEDLSVADKDLLGLVCCSVLTDGLRLPVQV